MYFQINPELRFWKYVDKHGVDECWPWIGARNHKGYGRFRLGDRNSYAHRFSWDLHNGPIPEGLFVLHKCDNPSCVNPNHLFLGTNNDNMADKISKGRAADVRGERNGRAKLTEAEVLDMRALHAGGYPGSILAEMFGMSRSAVYALLNLEHWPDIK